MRRALLRLAPLAAAALLSACTSSSEPPPASPPTTTATPEPRCTPPAAPGVPGLRFDGLYVAHESESVEKDEPPRTIWQFARFYPDGLVVLAAVQHQGDEPPVANVAKWLVHDAKVGSVGCYTAEGSGVRFSARQRSGEEVQVDYTGSVEPDGLRLSWYSHKTKAGSGDALEYAFAPVTPVE